ncbi:MAG: nucleotidyltransferase family protein [Rikenellaceae bacterium]
MDREQGRQQLLLELMRCEIWGREIDLSLFERTPIDWSQILNMAQQQAVLGVVANSIARLPLALQPSREVQIKLHHRVTLNRQQYHYQAAVAGDILEDLKSVGVDRGVVLKGLGMSQNYPDPSARMCGDIDIFVGEQMYHRSREICTDPECTENPMHYEFHYKGVPVELHRSVTSAEEIDRRGKELVAWFNQALLTSSRVELVDVCGTKIETPDATFNAIYIFLHAYRHLVKGGIGLRQICDWALVLDGRSQQIDYAVVEQLLERHDLRRMWDVFIQMINIYLGFDMSKYPLACSASSESAGLVMDVILDRGNFGQYAKRTKFSKIYAIKQLQTLIVRIRELDFLMRIDRRRGIKTMLSIVFGGLGRTVNTLLGIKP